MMKNAIIFKDEDVQKVMNCIKSIWWSWFICIVRWIETFVLLLQIGGITL
jgi:hypothetical protein